jgi:hypothetical protein
MDIISVANKILAMRIFLIIACSRFNNHCAPNNGCSEDFVINIIDPNLFGCSEFVADILCTAGTDSSIIRW